ncbi:hypothetical protein FSP39_025239 [Pinctada imbricata]|uniref:Fibrinogen C-terminal domain-containing protein n=1 Tax=Pinctada imbricata TaxID=66713 RepID=A0AA88YG91_PINIB|nr:hypothetical protein FSP39_025239 [Pinctada imbricata]
MATVRRNCEDWRLHRHTTKGYYLVDPTESGTSFEVECDLSSNPAKTIMHHDKETRTFFSRSANGNYMTVDVTYWLALDKIDAVKTRASSCSQYVKMECFRNAIEFADNKAYWLGRHSEKYTYWGDVYGNSGYCECGLPANCEILGDKCNCETSTLTWKYDDGNLVDMAALPLRQLRSDYLVNNAKGYHTIGPLICTDVDPRSWIETPAGVTLTFMLVVISFLSIVMVSLTCYRRHLWKQLSWKCKKKQSVT